MPVVFTQVSYSASAGQVHAAASFYSNFNHFKLVDQNGHVFKVDDLKGKVTLFNFIFTQCSTACPIQTKQLSEVKKSLPPEQNKKVQFVSVSLDPLADTPKRLKSFAKRNGVVDQSWSFITGKPDNIQALVNSLQLYGNEKQAKSSKKPNDHILDLWLVDQNGRLLMRYSGNPMDVKRVSKDIGQLGQM